MKKIALIILISTITVAAYAQEVGNVSVGSEATMVTQPASLNVYGKDVFGSTLPSGIGGSVFGMTWGITPGNTLGRLTRLAQWVDNSGNYQFFDQGIDQAGDYYLAEHAWWNTGAAFPKKMLTITPSDFVGINFNWGEHPTANFHTKGSVRFEGVNTNNALTRVLVMDVNGNLSTRDASTLSASSYWVADANGIRNNNSTGHVGIGGASSNISSLNVEMMEGTTDGRATARFASNELWQTALRLDNTTTSKSFYVTVGGVVNTFTNYGVGAGNFGIINGTIGSPTNTIPFIITSDDKVGISSRIGGSDNAPKSRLHVRDGDVYIDQIGSGVIMKSPSGQCWRMTVTNAGAPVFTPITCP